MAAAKEAYKEAFARLDLVATEIEQRKSITDLRNGNGDGGKDLSKFEEIDDIGKLSDKYSIFLVAMTSNTICNQSHTS